MIQYLELLDRVLTKGTPRHGEKPEGTLTIFGDQVKYDLSAGFPLLTVRDLSRSWERIIKPEILWMMSGSTSAIDLEEQYDCKLWNRWAEDSKEKLGTPEGELGPVYGHQLRNWNDRTDQLVEVLGWLKNVPETRRGVISLWNVEDVETQGQKRVNVANCVTMLHLSRMNYKVEDGIYESRLDMNMTQRSADIPAGVPHDIAGWALFQMMVAREVGIRPGTLTHTIEDGQIYEKQIEHVKELLKREPYHLPTVTIDDSISGSMFDHKPEDFQLHNYQSHPKMLIPVAT